MKKYIGILVIFLIVTSTTLQAAKKTTFDDMLSLLKEKEKIEEKNTKLINKIKILKKELKDSKEKYEKLLADYNLIKESKKKKNIKDNELIVNEIKSRLPVPYLILDYDNEKIAKVLKLKWYYVFNKDGNAVFNGRYLDDQIKIGDKYLTYKVKNIFNDHIEYCLIKDNKKCVNKYLINNNIASSMRSIEIINGIPDEVLVNKNNFQDVLSKILSNTNPLTQKIEKLNKENSLNLDNFDFNNGNNNQKLDNIINPKKNNKKTGATIPKNNIPDLSNINNEKFLKGKK